jgi:single-strand DNA-binding protein
MNETWITVVGNVVDEPKLRETKAGNKVLSFRVASTSRRFDKEQERWADNETMYASVTCWRWFAENVAASLHKGQPVVVTGQIFTREYRKDEVVRASYEIEAVAVGHDMSRGRSVFTKTPRPRVVTQADTDENGVPLNLVEDRLDLLPEDAVDTEREAVLAG